jgi:hypothetical protein
MEEGRGDGDGDGDGDGVVIGATEVGEVGERRRWTRRGREIPFWSIIPSAVLVRGGEGGCSSMGGRSDDTGDVECGVDGRDTLISVRDGSGGRDGGTSEVGFDMGTESDSIDDESAEIPRISKSTFVSEVPLLLRRCRPTMLSLLMLSIKPRFPSSLSFPLSFVWSSLLPSSFSFSFGTTFAFGRTLEGFLFLMGSWRLSVLASGFLTDPYEACRWVVA